MADSRVDELFSGAGAARPRLGWIYFLLSTGLAAALVGMLCTSAPGGILVLAAWLIVEQESDRLESGFLPSDTEPAIAAARSRAWVGLVIVVGLFVVQSILLCTTSFYPYLYATLAALVFGGEVLPT
jgi:hypothetical protein